MNTNQRPSHGNCMMNLSRTVRLLPLLLALLAWTPFASADEALWSLLKGGGQVILVRHALTTPGVGDPEGMTLGDCSTQRNLNDEGRAHARQLGDAFRTRGVAVGNRQLQRAHDGFGVGLDLFALRAGEREARGEAETGDKCS